jgi:predicted HTH domain antitoxin
MTNSKEKQGIPMLPIQIMIPENLILQLGSSIENTKIEAQKLLAIKLFEVDYLTTGQAASMCNMNRVDFMIELSKMNIPVVNMDRSEIQKEIEEAFS